MAQFIELGSQPDGMAPQPLHVPADGISTAFHRTIDLANVALDQGRHCEDAALLDYVLPHVALIALHQPLKLGLQYTDEVQELLLGGGLFMQQPHPLLQDRGIHPGVETDENLVLEIAEAGGIGLGLALHRQR